MIPFVLGQSLVFGAACAVAIVGERVLSAGRLFWDAPPVWTDVLVQLLVLPVAASLLTLDALNRFRPRRWLDGRVCYRAHLLAAGAASALLALLALGIVLAWLEERVPAWLLVAACITPATGAAFTIMPRIQPGRCIRCGYDVRDGSGGGRCPECGTLDP